MSSHLTRSTLEMYPLLAEVTAGCCRVMRLPNARQRVTHGAKTTSKFALITSFLLKSTVSCIDNIFSAEDIDSKLH